MICDSCDTLLFIISRNVEYHPVLFRQHEGHPHVEVDSFNKVRVVAEIIEHSVIAHLFD